MAFGWESERLRLVPLERDKHFENCYRWINDPTVTRWLSTGDFPSTRARQEEFFSRLDTSATPSEIVFAIELLDGTHIGNSGLHNIRWRTGIATTGTLIGSAEHHGQGYGTEAAILRARYAFKTLNLRMLTSLYYSANERTARMQATVGYVEYGRLPDALWNDGQWYDDVLTVLTKERFVELHGPL